MKSNVGLGRLTNPKSVSKLPSNFSLSRKLFPPSIFLKQTVLLGMGLLRFLSAKSSDMQEIPQIPKFHSMASVNLPIFLVIFFSVVLVS